MWRSVAQAIGEFSRTLLLRLKQPRVLDRDDGLIREGRGELHLLLIKWVHLIAGERENTDRRPLTH